MPARSTAMHCMSASRFTLDTNVLVYALDRRAEDRHRLAATIIDRAVLVDCWLTLQSISEFFAVSCRRSIVPVPEAVAQVQDWLEMFPTAPASAEAIRSALALAAAGRASYWDALLLATAHEAGCTAILTEDLADGATLGGVRIINPFAGTTLSAAAEALLAES